MARPAHNLQLWADWLKVEVLERPQDKAAKLQLATALVAQRKFQAAEALAQESLPDSARMLAHILFHLGRIDDAICWMYMERAKPLDAATQEQVQAELHEMEARQQVKAFGLRLWDGA